MEMDGTKSGLSGDWMTELCLWHDNQGDLIGRILGDRLLQAIVRKIQSRPNFLG
jgi:hypothetical protein